VLVQHRHRFAHAQAFGLVEIGGQAQSPGSQLHLSRSLGSTRLQGMSRIDFLLTMSAPALFGDQLRDGRAYDRDLFDVLSELALVVDRAGGYTSSPLPKSPATSSFKVEPRA
jgi:hypothetical protein